MDVIEELKVFYDRFDGEKGSVGKSFFGKDILYFVVRKTAFPRIVVQYTIHAREYICTFLALKQIEDFLRLGAKGTVYFIPLMNPDGVEIALSKEPLYKANGRGVDLNVNFDAHWGEGKTNTHVCGSENYIGKHPFSEPESRALRDFTLKVKPDLTVSYHSKGEEIYWEFFQDGKRRRRDFSFAKVVSDVTGYEIKSTPDSVGGYKDWCVEELKIPALTLEVGSDQLSHPIGKERLSSVYDKNAKVIFALIEKFGEINGTKIYEGGDKRGVNCRKKGRGANRCGNRLRRGNRR